MCDDHRHPVVACLGSVLQGVLSRRCRCSVLRSFNYGFWVATISEELADVVAVVLEGLFCGANAPDPKELSSWDVVDTMARMARCERQVVVGVCFFGVELCAEVPPVQFDQHVQIGHAAFGTVCCELYVPSFSSRSQFDSIEFFQDKIICLITMNYGYK